MNFLFHSGDSISLYILYFYAKEIKKRTSANIDLIWHPAVPKKVPVEDLNYFDTVYSFPYTKQDVIKFKKKGINRRLEYLGHELLSYVQNIDYHKYDFLLIFKDTSIRDKALIESVGETTKVVLIEEGLSLYHPESHQGMHEKIDCIMCNYPGKLYKNRKSLVEKVGSKRILQMSNHEIFNRKMSKIFTKELGISIEEKNRGNNKVVYIGQYAENDLKNLKNILNCIKSKIKLEIKTHPQDEKQKYSEVEADGVNILTNRWIPFEIMYPIIGYPTIITQFSTAGIQVSNLFSRSVIFTHKLNATSQVDSGTQKVIKNLGQKIYEPENCYQLNKYIEKVQSEFVLKKKSTI